MQVREQVLDAMEGGDHKLLSSALTATLSQLLPCPVTLREVSKIYLFGSLRSKRSHMRCPVRQWHRFHCQSASAFAPSTKGSHHPAIAAGGHGEFGPPRK